MAGAHGDALEWALALAKAPAERMSLRQRPLPEGIGTLLQIAAGHADGAVADAAARSGESPEDVLSAVRFYLREVLFHADADAYRMLGVRRDAEHDRIKAHHRLLQQWLHPDRPTSEWDAVFCARANAAWNHLRSDERRRAYDAEHPESHDLQRGFAASPLAWTGTAVPRVEPASPREVWRRRLPLLALLLACAALGALAVVDMRRDGAEPPADQMQAGDSGDLDLHLPTLAPAEPVVAGARRPDGSPPARTGQAGAPSAAVVLPRPSANQVASNKVATSPAVMDAVRPLPPPSRTAVVPPTPSVDRRNERPVQAAALSSASISAPPVPRSEAAPASAVPLPESNARPVTPVAGPLPVAVEPRATRQPISASQVQAAQRVGDRLLVFMTRQDQALPPIWDSLGAQRGATQMRGQLLARGAVAFDPPEWRVDGDSASMRAGLRQQGVAGARLSADLIWREERWLVSNLSLEWDR